VRNVNLATRVEPELAESVRRLAHLGNRTVSREVAEAVRRHVLLNSVGGEPFPGDSPVERRVPEPSAGVVDGAAAPGPER
jgi:hypothetical protein